jgi:uracil-DNA glycosylase
MKEALQALVHELRAQRRAGVDAVALAPQTLEVLRAAVARAAAAQGGNPVGEPAAAQPLDTSLLNTMLGDRSSSGATGGSEVRRPVVADSLLPLAPAVPDIQLPAGDKPQRWQWLREQLMADAFCQAQVRTGNQLVFGAGSLDAALFFCGEAPGSDEETAGLPFVGPAGQLLERIITAMGLKRDDVYLANIVNFRPPQPSPVGNRPPNVRELAHCLPYLRAQLTIVQPQVVIALGKTAVDGLLGADSKRRMNDVRGQWAVVDGFPLMITFHPSYLLRNPAPAVKRQVWEDMLAVMERVGLPISERQRRFFAT